MMLHVSTTKFKKMLKTYIYKNTTTAEAGRLQHAPNGQTTLHYTSWSFTKMPSKVEPSVRVILPRSS